MSPEFTIKKPIPGVDISFDVDVPDVVEAITDKIPNAVKPLTDKIPELVKTITDIIPDNIPEDVNADEPKALSADIPEDIPEDTFSDQLAEPIGETMDMIPEDTFDGEFQDTSYETPYDGDSVGFAESTDTGTYDIQADNISDVQGIDDVSGWLSDINPNFDPFDMDSPYCNNCGSCAYAVYQRLEGNTDICASAENIGYNSEMEALTGMEQVSMSPEEIQDRLLAEGDGAHAIIGIDRAEGPGHWFNAACIDGKVVAIDGQTGEITDWPPDYGDVVNWEMSVKKGV